MKKFTKSIDGEFRMDITLKMRVTKEELIHYATGMRDILSVSRGKFEKRLKNNLITHAESTFDNLSENYEEKDIEEARAAIYKLYGEDGESV